MRRAAPVFVRCNEGTGREAAAHLLHRRRMAVCEALTGSVCPARLP
jgi:hypothetical protein